MTSDQVKNILQAILSALGGFILAKGWVSAEMWAWISGGALTLIGTLWSMWTSRPAGIAGSAQALSGVEVNASGATPAVKAAVAAAK